MIKAEDFKIRCSQIGKIMTQPKTKAAREAGEISKTAQNYCDIWIQEHIYHRKHEFSSKYTEKGDEVEDASIDFIADQLGLGILSKNEKHFENDYMTGTPDIILPNVVIDAKNSWDCFTFPLLKKEIPNKDYWWQGQGYMELTGIEHFMLVYVLSDTPNRLIEKEAYFFAKNNGLKNTNKEILDTFYDRMTYSDIPNKYKIKVFEFDRDNASIELIKPQVDKCREYIYKQLKTI